MKTPLWGHIGIRWPWFENQLVFGKHRNTTEKDEKLLKKGSLIFAPSQKIAFTPNVSVSQTTAQGKEGDVPELLLFLRFYL